MAQAKRQGSSAAATQAPRAGRRRCLFLRTTWLPASLLLATEVACYLAFPLWHSRYCPPWWTVATAGLHALVLLVLLAWWQRSDTRLATIPGRWSCRQLRTPEGAALAVLIAGFGVVQLAVTRLPILSGPDEPEQVAMHLSQFQALAQAPATALAFLFSALGLAAGGGMVLAALHPRLTATEVRGGSGARGARRRAARKESRAAPSRAAAVRWVWVAAAALVLAAIGGYLLSEGRLPDRWGRGVRWPPVGTLATAAAHALVGENEPATRLAPVVFFLLTGVYVFRIVAAVADRWLAVAAAALCLAMPALFAQGHLASRETGGALFMTASVFYLLRHLRTGRGADFGLAALAVTLGYLERRPTALLVMVIPAVFVVARLAGSQQVRITRGWRGAWLYGGALVAVTWTVLPWAMGSSRARPFKLTPDNWLDWEIVSAYARTFPAEIGWPATILAVLGVIVALVRRRTWHLAALLWLAIVYGLFTSDDPYWIPAERFVALMAPSLALLAIAAVCSIAALARRVHVPTVLVALIVAVPSVLPAAGWLLDRPIAYTRPARAGGLGTQPRYPVDELVASLAEDGVTSARIATPVYWQTSLAPVIQMRNLRGFEVAQPPWVPVAERQTTVARLEAMCRANAIDYVVVPLRNPSRPRVLFVEDLTPEQLDSNTVPGFRVAGTWWHGNFGVTLLQPAARAGE